MSADRCLVLVSGPSGSGKSHLARLGGDQGALATISLDEFYRDEDYPGLPQTLGIVDWDHPDSWDGALAASTIGELLTAGRAEVPIYQSSLNRRVGSQEVDVCDSTVLLAEGIFAAELLGECRKRDVPAVPIWLDRPRVLNFLRRFVRDLREHRKPPLVLVKRGWALMMAEPAMRAKAVAAGFEPLPMRRARAKVSRLAKVRHGAG